ncbi:uncharacterized protein TNCT_623321 [Trichonephila clavata]|uniref:Uncharacterized protein n=1 Tax=Trichonephila clavata TaxID=2740835 RepID=A0A8X6H5V9_TRICU|nr:uncharacterized protein TNCT_623321 [Trichonephila clavata]
MTGNGKDTITFEESCDLSKGLFKTTPLKKRICLLKKMSDKSSKRKMSKPVKKIAFSSTMSKLEWTVASAFDTDAIYVPVDGCLTDTTFIPVDEKVSIKETVAEKIVSVKKELVPVKNEILPIKIENDILKKTYKPRRTLKYSKKNMTPEQIEDYYFARQVQVSERFHLRTRVPQPSSQLSFKSKTGVKTEAIPSDERKTRGYGVTPKLENVIGQKEMRPEKIQREMRKHMLPFNGSLVQCSENIAKSIFSDKCAFLLDERITRSRKHMIYVV